MHNIPTIKKQPNLAKYIVIWDYVTYFTSHNGQKFKQTFLKLNSS